MDSSPCIAQHRTPELRFSEHEALEEHFSQWGFQNRVYCVLSCSRGLLGLHLFGELSGTSRFLKSKDGTL